MQLTTISLPLTVEVNGDHVVNQLDWNVVFANWLATGVALAQGDANGDSVINQLDINTITGNWLATSPTNASAAAADEAQEAFSIQASTEQPAKSHAASALCLGRRRIQGR